MSPGSDDGWTPAAEGVAARLPRRVVPLRENADTTVGLGRERGPAAGGPEVLPVVGDAGAAGAAGARSIAAGETTGPAVIEVVYAGPDLGRVAELTGLTIDAVIAAHTAAPWQVEHCGFAPGFAYLTGGDPRLVVPRLDIARPEVPCGAVGLAGVYSGVYPHASPGGWNLIGRTDAVMWDLDRDPPALLRTGMTVRFRAVREHVRAGGYTAPDVRVSLDEAEATGPGITVVKPGILCLIEDLGRAGYEDMGVSPSGAADRGAASLANRILGNPDGAAVLEMLLGGAELSAAGDVTIAVTGAEVPLHAGGCEAVMGAPIMLRTGESLRIGRPKHGLRTYVSVRGGIDVPPVLGSRSTDTLSGLGPPPVTAGQRLPVGRIPAGAVGAQPGSDVTTESYSGATDIEIVAGPQGDWLGDDAWATLVGEAWTVSPQSNRIGVRLAGPALLVDGHGAGEMRAQPLSRGAIQVPPSGEPIVFLADHPVTGGYPVIAVLTDESVDCLAQVRPGGTLRLRRA